MYMCQVRGEGGVRRGRREEGGEEEGEGRREEGAKGNRKKRSYIKPLEKGDHVVYSSV
jgi:hypothetical protein